MKFKLIKYSEFNRKHFEESLTWAQYYEPNDIDTLQGLGVDRHEVSRELERVGWSDDYWFPVPDKTQIGSFMFEFRKANFTANCGRQLNGYMVDSGHCICLFGTNKEWTININLLDHLEEEIGILKADVGLSDNEKLFPIEVNVPFKGLKFVFAERS